jgi:hypothetical protein
MMPLRQNLAADYRARATAAREKAEPLPDGAEKAALLNDAALWDRMAAHEDKADPQT